MRLSKVWVFLAIFAFYNLSFAHDGTEEFYGTKVHKVTITEVHFGASFSTKVYLDGDEVTIAGAWGAGGDERSRFESRCRLTSNFPELNGQEMVAGQDLYGYNQFILAGFDLFTLLCGEDATSKKDFVGKLTGAGYKMFMVRKRHPDNRERITDIVALKLRGANFFSFAPVSGMSLY